jgi:hypothetical protein
MLHKSYYEKSKYLMFPGILFSRVISILIKILKRGSPGLPRDHPSSGDLPIARIQSAVLLELS